MSVSAGWLSVISAGIAPIRAAAEASRATSRWLRLMTATRSHGRTPSAYSREARSSTKDAHSA